MQRRAEVKVQAIVRRLGFGNFTGRAYPERVETIVELTIAQHARTAEQELLDAISASSTAVTTAEVLGAARDLLHVVSQAAAGYRSRHRMRAEAVLRVLIPAWVRDMIRADITYQQPGDGLNALAVADERIAAWFTVRHLAPVWYLDSRTGAGQVFGAQGATDLRNWPTVVEWYLFHEGAFLFLDGGPLDLGVVRDSTLNNINDFESFAETFEAAAFVGVES